ncbi:hypothetical protein FJZ31_17285 [Candidatus Poribacteria bacterium]|nr:hypothetical protein [Candidatus Poribacteria bacterium]
MARELEPDSLFQVLLKSFYLAFGIENLSQINTELKEILASSVRIDAIVTFDDDFDFTKLVKRIFPWLGKNNVFEYKGKFDLLKVGQYCQYSLVELGLVITRCLSKERKDKVGREWLSQKGVHSYWNKLKSQGTKYFCTITILSTGDPKGIREGAEFEPVVQYSHLQGALYRKIIFKDKFLGTIPVYLVVLNKLKTCAINAPLLLLSTGEKQKEFCQWLIGDAEGLTIEEQVTYQSYMIAYGVVENEEVRKQMGRKVWKPDYDKVAEWLYEGMPPEIRAKFIQKFLSLDSSLEEAILKLSRAKEQQKEENEK